MLPFPPAPKARAALLPGNLYAIDGGDSFIYYGQVAANKQIGFFHFRSQVLELERAFVSGLMSRFGVQYSTIGVALRAGAWQYLGKHELASQLVDEPIVVQWPVGTLDVTLWKGALLVGKTQVHDPSIQELEVISSYDAVHHVPTRLRADFTGKHDQWSIGGSVLWHRQQKQRLAEQHPDKPWLALPDQWVTA